MFRIRILAYDLGDSLVSRLLCICQMRNYELVVFCEGRDPEELVTYGEYACAVVERQFCDLNRFRRLRNGKLGRHPVIPVGIEEGEQFRWMEAGGFSYLKYDFEDSVLDVLLASAVSHYVHQRHLHVKIEDKLRFIRMMDSALFRFRTIEDAHVLSRTLSLMAPEPDRVAMGLMEILINAVEHGNLGLTYEEKTVLQEDGTLYEELERRQDLKENRDKYATVEVIQNGDGLRFLITDMGSGFDWLPYLQTDHSRLYESHGRGIAMAAMIAFSKIEYIGKGNQVIVWV